MLHLLKWKIEKGNSNQARLHLHGMFLHYLHSVNLCGFLENNLAICRKDNNNGSCDLVNIPGIYPDEII